MAKATLQKGQWLKLNTTYDLLITGGPYLFFMGGNAAPTTDGAPHLVTGPQVVPAGVGAYITAYEEGVTLVISSFAPDSGPAPVPFTVVA